ncbi:MAG: Mrp/NBP35 family ATP-binding protein [candidate division Zixibacteria bacterium]|nr:Mrp/NBP35 family ATP-binding protein [candidate division Zixibacteria bacterium]
MPTKEDVLKVLGGIDDPELRRPLTELDMIDYVTIEGDIVTVGVLLTIPGCPMKRKISDDIENGVGALEGVKKVKVEFDSMGPKQREELRQKLGGKLTASGGSGPTIEKFAKRFIAVSSGKGGVGKSTVAANLAAAMARKGLKVGILDADVYGFSIPRMLGVMGTPTAIDNNIVPLRRGDNLQVVSMGFFVDEDEPVIWRGPLLHKAITQFLTDVIWDELDYLFLDLPPGTGDVTLTIAQAVPSAELLVVTTPQDTATHVAGRVAKLATRTKLKVIGVVENMAYYETDGGRDYIFGKDGGKQLANRLGVPLLAEIPLRKSIREGCDNGNPVALEGDSSEVSLFESIAEQIAAMDGR